MRKSKRNRPNDVREDRFQFIGIEALDKNQSLPIGGHIVSQANPQMPVKTQGYLTSACMSPTLEKSIGLGIVARGNDRIGEEIFIYSNGKTYAAKIVSPTHFDVKGDRLNV